MPQQAYTNDLNYLPCTILCIYTRVHNITCMEPNFLICGPPYYFVVRIYIVQSKLIRQGTYPLPMHQSQLLSSQYIVICAWSLCIYVYVDHVYCTLEKPMLGRMKTHQLPYVYANAMFYSVSFQACCRKNDPQLARELLFTEQKQTI